MENMLQKTYHAAYVKVYHCILRLYKAFAILINPRTCIYIKGSPSDFSFIV